MENKYEDITLDYKLWIEFNGKLYHAGQFVESIDCIAKALEILLKNDRSILN